MQAGIIHSKGIFPSTITKHSINRQIWSQRRNPEYIQTMSASQKIALILLFLTCISSQPLPFTLMSLQYPSCIHYFIRILPGSSLQFHSSHLSPDYLTLSTREQKVVVQPQLDPKNVLYNEPYNDLNEIGLIAYFPEDSPAKETANFHYVKVRSNGSEYDLLLSTFYERIRAIRTDQLYRCSNTLIAVNWLDSQVHVWKFSLDEQEQWDHVDDLQQGQVYRDHGVLYGYAIDYNEAFPVKIRIRPEHYCLIERGSKPVQLEYDWSRQKVYSLAQVLSVVQPNLELLKIENEAQSNVAGFNVKGKREERLEQL